MGLTAGLSHHETSELYTAVNNSTAQIFSYSFELILNPAYMA